MDQESIRVAPRQGLAKLLQSTSWAEKLFWDFIIADEAHRLKPPSGKASLEFKRLRTRAGYRIALTGTPMPHGPMDISAIFRFLDVTIFGPSFSAFRAKYAVMGGYHRKQVTGYQNLEELERQMSRITFRVGPEVLDLPPATEVTYYCALTGEAARIYKDLDEDFVARVKDGTVTAANAMVKILRLQQVTGGCVPTDDGEGHRVDSSKLKLLADTLEDIGPDEPAVVFCRFHADLDAVRQACEANGYTAMESSGRRDQLKRWQNGEAQVLAVQIDSGGEGGRSHARPLLDFLFDWLAAGEVRAGQEAHAQAWPGKAGNAHPPHCKEHGGREGHARSGEARGHRRVDPRRNQALKQNGERNGYREGEGIRVRRTAC